MLQLVRTDIAGFVGLAERGPLPEDFKPADVAQAAVKIGNWKEFLTHFGSFQEYSYLAYSVFAFFANGGRDCYVVRVAATTLADPSQNAATAFFTVPSGAPAQLGTIGQKLDPFHCAVTLSAGASPIASGDLLFISDGGVTQLVQVASVAVGEVLLSAQVPVNISAGATVLRFPAACRISAASRGNWGNGLCVQITPLGGDAFSLRAFVDLGPQVTPTEDEYYRNLNLADPDSYNYAPTVLSAQSNLVRMEITGAGPIGLPLSPSALLPVPPIALSSGVFYLQGGRDGLSGITLNDFSGSAADLRGLRLLEQVEQVGILAVPDAVFQPPVVLSVPPGPVDTCLPVSSPTSPPLPDDPTAAVSPLSAQDSTQLQRMMIDQCERLRYRVAIIDPPGDLQISEVETWPAANALTVSPASRFAALYYPWMMAPDSLELDGPTRNIPPSGYAAGAYAQTDLTYGVQRPPANVELQAVVDVVQSVSDLQQQNLNLNNVNAIRAFPGRGIRVWGARSLAAPGDEDWRFIHVRRLMSAIEETVEKSSRWAVFQNNTVTLRSSLTHSLTVLLTGIWTKGGLQGTKPADAFYVKCDSTNNPQPVIDQGQLICEIGIAIAAPMEFLVFEIRQDAAGAQILES